MDTYCLLKNAHLSCRINSSTSFPQFTQIFEMRLNGICNKFVVTNSPSSDKTIQIPAKLESMDTYCLLKNAHLSTRITYARTKPMETTIHSGTRIEKMEFPKAHGRVFIVRGSIPDTKGMSFVPHQHARKILRHGKAPTQPI